jgi:hypothetical protein
MRGETKIFTITLLILSLYLTGCGGISLLSAGDSTETVVTQQAAASNDDIDTTVDISDIRNICDLATLKCYYHDVAKGTKAKEKGPLSIGQILLRHPWQRWKRMLERIPN